MKISKSIFLMTIVLIIYGCASVNNTNDTLAQDFINKIIDSAPETSAWTILSEDSRYILQDVGTSPGLRGVIVWQVDTEEMVFSGYYYDDFKMNENIIEIVYPNVAKISDFNDDLTDFAENFLHNNPEPPLEMIKIAQETGLSISLLIFCDFDLETRNRNIIRADYVLTQ